MAIEKNWDAEYRVPGEGEGEGEGKDTERERPETGEMMSSSTDGEPLAKHQRNEDENGNTTVDGATHNRHGGSPHHECAKTPAALLPCEHGVDCTETDLIHFAEFWHPTKRDEASEASNKDSCREEEECEVVELKGDPTLSDVEVESTQPVFEEFSDSEDDSCEANGSSKDNVSSYGSAVSQ